MRDIIRKIQSRLKRKDINKSSQQIREVYTLILGQNENPTEQEITSVMDKLSENNDNQLVDVKETIDITVKETEHQLVDIANVDPEKEEDPAEKEEEDDSKDLYSLTTIQPCDKANALVFVDPFSKALAIKQSVVNSDIQLTDTQVFELSTNIPNEFSDQADLTKHILAFVHDKYDLESLRSRLIIDESLEELRNKQQQFRLETSLKVKKTFDIIHENSMKYREADEKLLQALKDSYQKIEDRRNNKNGN